MGSLNCEGGSTWYNMNENLPKRQTTDKQHLDV